jgi:signal transduction histidine kinase/CheY-like chemotaxis protein/HPt (histidine-containing phosphotransfer) domain-containing protein
VGGRTRISIKRLLVVLLAILGVLVGALSFITTRQLDSATHRAESEKRRFESIGLADSLRKSSDDLTNMVRLYVTTGQPRYRRYYNELLAIRNGYSPRPRHYDAAFWDRVLSGGKAGVTYGPPQSLTALMRKAGFAPSEFEALSAALRTSNRLAEIETDVIRRVAARIARGVDAAYARDVRPQLQRLVNAEYLREKRRIMEAIERFSGLVDARTAAETDRFATRNDQWLAAQVAILALIVATGIAALFVLGRLAVRPLGQLIAATRDIAGGNYGRRAEIRAAAELEHLATDFNAMASAIEGDIARREEAQAQAAEARELAEHASRAKSTFLAAMSHEIRTPMIGVMGMLEVLARTDLDEHQRGMLDTSQSSAQSLITIIGDVLDFSKIEAGKLEIEPVTIGLRELVDATVNNFVHTASIKGLLLSADIDAKLAPAVVGDPIRLRQILSNFLSNAVKFTEVGGIEVTVRVLEQSPADQRIEIAVRDTGIGIAPEVQAGLFAPFAQAGVGTTRRFGGTGLGLVICRRLAELMGGEITMTSAPGAGTTMRLVATLALGDPARLESIEAVDDPRAPVSRPLPSVAEAEREGSLLLLAEDHPVNRKVLVSQLNAVGFAVETANDGVDALAAFRSGRYALVFSDLNMPRMDGYQLVGEIRALEAAEDRAHTPVIALTANVMQGEPERCAAAGMDDFVGKPTTIPFLAAKLRRWLPHVAWPQAAPPAAVAPPAQAAPAGSDVLDPAALNELTGGDQELAGEVLQDFLEESRSDLTGLRAAGERRDAGESRAQAHRINGASRMVGAREIREIAGRIEAQARSDAPDWELIDGLLDQLPDALDRVAAAADERRERAL